MPNDQDSFYLYLRRLAEHSPSVLQSCEIGMTTAQGVELYANLEGAGVENSASSTDQCRLMISDATARRRAEEHQRDLTFEKERVGILQRFIGDASHDLKTPLTTMKVSLAVLRKSSDPIKQQRHLNILEAQAARLERLLDDLLNMTRLDMILEIDPTPFDLNVLILKIIAEQEERAKQKDLATKFLPDTSLPLIVADKDQISRAITALVVNAFNYTPRNGIITIRTYVQARQHIVEVEDTGIGIGEADLPHIFTRFFRADAARNTEKGGMGLGLAIAKKIIEMHQGNIAVKSTLGVGSAFTVVLPSLTVGN
jgi:signal transduction histidine kinase